MNTGAGDKKKKALDVLHSPQLLQELAGCYDYLIPGQGRQKTLLILIYASSYLKSKTEKLHLLINSESSAGKSFLMKKYAKLLPPGRKEYFTRITPTALAYFEANNDTWTWNNKVLFLEDAEEGIVNSDVLKVFLSEGSEMITVSNQKAIRISINGSPTIILTTCEPIPKKEMLNRFVLMNLDETPEQTKKTLQCIAREYTSGRGALEPHFLGIFQYLQLSDVNTDFVGEIAQYFESADIRVKRDFRRFITLICASAVLHQFQRGRDKENLIIANEQDYTYAREALEFIAEGGDVELTHGQKKALAQLKTLLLGKNLGENEGVDGKVSMPKTEIDTFRKVSTPPNQSTPSTYPLIIDEKKNEGVDCVDSVGGVVGYATAKEIYGVFPNRSLRNWMNILDRLAAKGYLRIRTMENPKTRREAAFYYLAQRNVGLYRLPVKLEFFRDTPSPAFLEQSTPSKVLTSITTKNEVPAYRSGMGDVLGPYAKGETLRIPAEEADILVKSGLAAYQEQDNFQEQDKGETK